MLSFRKGNKASLSFGRTSAGIVCYFWGSFGTIEGTIYFSSVSIREIPHHRLYIQGNRNAHKLKRITFDGGRRGWEEEEEEEEEEVRIKVMRTRGLP